ncbi:protein MAINTENANCE OF MERISTEMS-like [Tasmannia lanceolata]|uniref:protein MAINTENANCE OF MERISTEMS-like n=1 Tax=Tasmannia lanceolata TaxID=3420 RepID=UPI004063898C
MSRLYHWPARPAVPGDDYYHQLVRSFVMGLLGHTLFSNTGNAVRREFLSIICDIDRLAEYDWGGAAYDYLIRETDALSRDGSHSLCGLWYIWAAWGYECFSLLTPVPRESTRVFFPAQRRWNWETESRPLYSVDQVRWRLLDDHPDIMGDAYNYTRSITRRTVAFICHMGLAIYLPDRIA